jgi:hypothetical protein
MTGKGRTAKMKIMAKLAENIYHTTKVFGDRWNKPKVRAANAAVRQIQLYLCFTPHRSCSIPPWCSGPNSGRWSGII